MKKTILISVLLANLFSINGTSQELKQRWSNEKLLSNKTGFFNDMLGVNSKYIYGLESGIAFNSRKGPKFIKIVAYDKKTMNQVAEFVVHKRDDKSNKTGNGKLSYYKTIVLENVIYTFWKNDQKLKDELYVQAFDPKLKTIQKRKKVYEIYSEKKDAKGANIVVLGNQASDNQVLIIGEMSTAKNEDVKIEYKLLNQDFSFAASKQITLPIKLKPGISFWTSGLYGSPSSYEFGDDGMLYISTRVTIDKEDKKEAKKSGQQLTYPIYTVVELASGNMHNYDIKFDKKNIFDYHFFETPNEVKFYGLFCDLNLDNRGTDLHGIFSFSIDKTTFNATEPKFEFFTKEVLNQLFATDHEDRKDKAVFSSKKKKASENESISSLYEIEYSTLNDDGGVTLFCTKEYNYSVTTCSGTGSNYQCNTRYYCQKDNVTIFNLKQDGTLSWATNIDRRITYNGWYVDDVNVVVGPKGDYFVTYGSRFDVDAKKKNMGSKKSAKQVAGAVEYALVNGKNGAFTKKELKINADNVKSKDKKRYDPSNVEVIDNKFYIQSSNLRSRIWPWAVCVVCPPFAIYAISPANKVGKGFLGEIEPTAK